MLYQGRQTPNYRGDATEIFDMCGDDCEDYEMN